MIVEYLLYAAIGKVLVYMLQKFPLVTWLAGKSAVLEQLFSCGLCLGFWVYFALAFWLKVNILWVQPVLREIITASVTTLLVHLVSIGWVEQFGTVVIE